MPGARTRTREVSPKARGTAIRRPSKRLHFNGPVIEDAVRRIIEAIGEDPAREGLIDTPRRISQTYAEVFGGIHQDPARVLAVGFDTVDHHEMVVLRDIPFASMCEHHFLPFRGVAHVGYLPNGRIVGVSKIARVVETLARRPQVQERLTSQIADLLMDGLRADGAAVVIEAEHLCMTLRGVRKPGSTIVTSAMRGAFRDDARTRAEFMSLIRRVPS
jgi:GTP cyclohydrolase I